MDEEPRDVILLNQSERPTARHYTILAMCWAGWLFDFYDLMLFSFLLVPIRQSMALTDGELSVLLGASLAAPRACTRQAHRKRVGSK